MFSRSQSKLDGAKQPDGSGRARPGHLSFRPEIEGLRAVAVGAVLLCHANLPFAEGGFVGVDVFFVISGFLITRLLVDELERRGRLSLTRFYAYRVKRLLPQAATVLVFTAIGSALLFSPARNELVSGDILSAALYVVNWHFAAQSVDYFAPETVVSPVQHFWSLAIEEQFYVVWPLLLIGAYSASRLRGGKLRPILAVTAVSVAAGSLLYSAVYTADAPSAAYFSTLTRGWELAFGGALALVHVRRPGRWMGVVLAFGGITAIGWAVFSYNAATPFPGTAALLPVLGVLALIVAGTAEDRRNPILWLLETRAFRYVGSLSYAWYLWHWPVLVFGLAIWGDLAVWATTLLVAASWVPAAISHHLIENPLRRSPSLRAAPRRALALGAGCSAVGVVVALWLPLVGPTAETVPADQEIGASDLRPPELQERADAVRPKPTSEEARGDRGAIWDQGCMLEPEVTESGECIFGDHSGRKTAVLFGDSHAMHFFAAVEAVAERRGWRLIALTKAGCPPYDTLVFNPKVGRQYTECVQWQQHALERIERERPDVVLAAGSIWHKAMDGDAALDGPKNVGALEAGYVRMLERLRTVSADVVALQDLPKAPHDMTDCVSANLDDLRRCSFPHQGEGADHFEVRAASRVEGVHRIDLSPALCSAGTCFGVIRDALVYRDNDHMTATFARTLAPWLERELRRAGL